MSGLQSLVGGGADCGPSNALSQLSKVYNNDRGIQADHYQQAGPSNQGFRSRQQQLTRHQTADPEINRFYQPHSQQQQRPFDLTPLNRALTPQLQHAPPVPAWAQAFNQSDAGARMEIEGSSDQEAFSRAFERSQSGTPEWAGDFVRFDGAQNDMGQQRMNTIQQQQQQHHGREMEGRMRSNHYQQQRNPIAQARLYGAGVGGSFANGMMMRQDQNVRQTGAIVQSVVQSSSQDWETAFMSQEAMKMVVDPLAAYTQTQPAVITRPRSPVLSDSMARDALAQTAGQLLSTVESAESSLLLDRTTEETRQSNEKFANSTFLDLMRKLRDGEVIVEGDKVVEQIGPRGAEGVQSKGKGRESAWASDFGREEEGRVGAGVIPSPLINPDLNFATRNGLPVYRDQQAGYNDMEDIWEEEDLARMQRETAKVERQQRVQFQGDGGVNQEEMEREEEMMERADTRVVGATENWEEDFGPATIVGGHSLAPRTRENQAPSAQQLEWDALQNDWDTFEATSTGFKSPPLASASTSSSLFGYSFAQNNPYLNLSSHETTRTHEMHAPPRTTYETLLEREAAVLSNPTDSHAWLALGIKQQENEREEMAILALTRALELDPDMKEAYLALAVSYTNENERGKAYESIDRWINCLAVSSRSYAREIDNYRDLLGKLPAKGPAERHEYLSRLLIRLAQSRAEKDGGDVDADVQIGLGVLFNTSEEYEKAGDCFESALSVRPDDPLLFNRLGATLANSGKAREAIRYYLEAIDIQPSYVRARFNLAVANMNLNFHHIAAKHLLTALSIQESDSALRDNVQNGITSGVTSQALWDSLNIALLMMHQNEIAAHCAKQDITTIKELLGRIPMQVDDADVLAMSNDEQK